MTGPRTFRFLNVEREASAPSDWNHSTLPRLWLYNLHYFDDLAADDAASRLTWHRELIDRWNAENSPGQGSGWEPYPTSLRIVNWVKWSLSGAGSLSPEAAHSLAVQARWLRTRLEVHLLGNHLWANAKALVFAGVFFAGAEADVWREKGLVLLHRELSEQVLPDGGHFERSPMYHAIVLEDVLDLLQLAQQAPGVFAASHVDAWRETASRLLRWLRVMTHPDGGIALFNDAALSIAPQFAALEDYARAVGIPRDPAPLAAVEALAASGYVRLAAGPAVVIADVGEIGPSYLPGHAHADTLSFELSLRGQRVLVNGGTSTYESGAERLRQRGTAAHNTVVVDGEDSSEVWSSFRVARRAFPAAVSWGGEGDRVWLEGSHDGYRRLRGRVLHHRRWDLSATELRITDRLEGEYSQAEAGFLLHPSILPTSVPRERGEAESKGLLLRTASGNLHVTAEPDSLTARAGQWCPEFGRTDATTRLVASLPSANLVTTWTW